MKFTQVFAVVTKRAWIAACVLFLMTLVAYIPATRCGYIWDDDAYVTNNPTLRDLNGFRRIWTDPTATPQYYPLVYTSFWLEYHLWRLNPIGYHTDNVVLHAFAAILLWRVLLALRLPGAWLAAAIFALHPVAVESVAWISERKNVLSAAFYLAAGLSYLQFASATDAMEPRRRWYFVAFIFFICALLSKTVTCTLPAALLLVTWWKTGNVEWRDVVRLFPFFLIGITLGLCTASIEKHHVGAEGAAWSLTIPERLLIAGRAIWFYAGKLLWPDKLTFIYPRRHVEIGSAAQWLLPTGVIVLLVILWQAQRRVGRGPVAAVLFFIVTLFPALGFVDVYPFRYSFVADHFQYLASLGLIALGATFLDRVPCLVPASLLAVLAVLTWRQIGIYRDLGTLWHDTVEKNPGSWMAQDSYAGVLLRKGQNEEAMWHSRAAEKINPNNVETQAIIGQVLVQRGRIEEALPYFQKAVQLRPDIPAANYNLGNALLRDDRVNHAIDYLQKTIALDKTYLPAYDDLGNAFLRAGRAEESLAMLQTALKMDPTYTSAHFNIANTLLQLGRAHEAIAHLREVLAAHPRDPEALKNMAWVLATSPDATLRDGSRAIEFAKAANELTAKSDPIVGATLAAAYAEAGRFGEAIATAKTALDLAHESGNEVLTQVLRNQIELYELGLPFRDNR